MTTAFWHPFANMAQVAAGPELVVAAGDGVWVTDEDGRRYIDATAGLWYCNAGYGRSEIVDRVAAQMRVLPSYSCFGNYANRPALELCERIAALSPLREPKVFLTSGGSDAVETAAKLVLNYWSLEGRSEKRWILSRDNAYHGSHGFGTSFTGIGLNIEGLGRVVPSTGTVAWDDPEALAARIDELGPGNVAAFIGEPFIGAGGVLPPPDGYWARVAEICREREVLLIADEVISAWGRVGSWFASERLNFEPDIVLFAKGVTSGYLPLGGLIVGRRIQRPFWEGDGAWFRHGYTYSGHAAGCAAALANLDLIEADSLVVRARQGEADFQATLAELSVSPLVAEVRGFGLAAAVVLDPASLRERPGLVQEVVQLAGEEGVLTRALGGGALHVSPALVISPEETDEMVSGLSAAIARADR